MDCVRVAGSEGMFQDFGFLCGFVDFCLPRPLANPQCCSCERFFVLLYRYLCLGLPLHTTTVIFGPDTSSGYRHNIPLLMFS